MSSAHKAAQWLLPALVACLGCAPAGAADSQSIGLVVKDGAWMPPSVMASFAHQTEQGLRQIVAGPELRIVWRAEGEIAPGEAFDRLIVLRFRGDCSLSTFKAPAWGGPLGATWVTDGRILPFIDVDCGRVKATLVRTAPGQQRLLMPEVLGRALSRVALHEVYHVLTGRKHHDNEGLFKAEYSADDLLMPANSRGLRPAALSVVSQER